MSTSASIAPFDDSRREDREIERLTIQAFDLAQQAVTDAVDAISQDSRALYDRVAEREKELDRLDSAVDERVAKAVALVPEAQVADVLACMKLMNDLERIGDLISSFASRAQTVGTRLEMQDVTELIQMATMLEQMIAKVKDAFARRSIDPALVVLHQDSEIDRLRNLIYVRHVEQRAGVGQESLQVLFMAQAIERAGDHAKNLAEEVCHLLTGHTLRHIIRLKDQPFEQLYIHWLRTHAGKV